MPNTTEFNMSARRASSRPELASLGLIEITENSRPELLCALVGRDEVHDVGVDTAENILKYRVGGDAFNRSCFAVKDHNGGALQSAIYLHKNYDLVETPGALCGNVRDILSHEKTPVTKKPLSIIFYSITRLGTVKGAGEILIGKLHTHLTDTHPHAILSTLSPLRQPKEKYGIDDYLSSPGMPVWSELDSVEQRAFALNFLLQKKEGVQNFHMGNGAIIGDIKLDADRIGKHRLMVNYIYPRDKDTLRQNAVQYRNSVGEELLALVSPHLAREREHALPASFRVFQKRPTHPMNAL